MVGTKRLPDVDRIRGGDRQVTPAVDPSAAGSLPPGSLIEGRFEVLEAVGEGGMGQVYRARDRDGGAEVAVKVLDPGMVLDPTVMVRFRREANSARKVVHPNVVRVVAVSEEHATMPFYVMEYLRGEPVGALIDREAPLPFARAQPILIQVLAGLKAAHTHGVIHRDIKPDNCFLVPSEDGQGPRVKLLDFGIAKVLRQDSQVSLTQRGIVMGTPHYMSPEQARGDRVDHRTDVYSVGVLAYHLLTGKLPYDAAEPLDVLLQKEEQDAPAMRRRAPEVNVPSEVEAVVARALDRDPRKRWTTAAKFAEALAALDAAVLAGRRRGFWRRLFGR